MRRRTASLLLVGALLTGCAAGGAPPPATATTEATALPLGSAEIAVTGEVLSPGDFAPRLRLTVPAGWSSAHRGDDGFDLRRPGISVAFLTPAEATAAEALATLRARTASTSTVRAAVGGRQATGFDVVGGAGLLVESPAGTLTVNRAADRQSRVLAIDLADVPLLIVVTAADLGAAQPAVDALLQGVVED